MTRDWNLHCELRYIHGRPYNIVRPTLVYRIEQWPSMMAWCEKEFGPIEPFVPGIVGQRVKVNRWNQRVYADLTRFWFRDQADRDRFLQHWS